MEAKGITEEGDGVIVKVDPGALCSFQPPVSSVSSMVVPA